jgi:hypothetical protein
VKDHVVNDLRKEGVRFPETPKWTGVVTAMHTAFYFFGVLYWSSLAIVCATYPQWKLSKFGL